MDDIIASVMKRKGNYLKRPLDWVLAVSSHIAVLRVLKDSVDGMSGRAVAREAGFTHQAIREAIAKLEGMGIVQRIGSGKVQLIRLNREHALVSDVILPMFSSERQAMAKLGQWIREEFKDKARAATVFGSVARNEADPQSDLDLLLIAPKGKRKDYLSDRASELAQKMRKEYGLRLSSIVYTEAEVRQKARQKLPLLTNIVAEGYDLLDTSLGDIIE